MKKLKKQNDKRAKIYFRELHPFLALIKPMVIMILLGLSYYPSKIVEVFLRKNFGERYYSLEPNVIIFLLMSIPLGAWIFYGSYSAVSMMGFSWAWILFTFVYLGFAIKRRREINKKLQSFDSCIYSYYSGDTLSLWDKYGHKLPKVFPNEPLFYNVERVYEGGLFILLGIFLLLIPFTSSLGLLLFVAGLSYNFTAYVRYSRSRSMMLDKIDNKIYNTQIYDAIVNGESQNGLRWSGPQIEDKDFRDEIARSFSDLDVDEATGFVS